MLIKYGYQGDTNLDGKVDPVDYFTTLFGQGSTVGGPENGDVNNDGVTDPSDYFIVLFNQGFGDTVVGLPPL